MDNETCGISPRANTAVGLGYIATATLIIPLHIVCSYLMWKDKDMRTPTYQFMINLSIADVMELVPLGLYAGAVILIRRPQAILVERVMAFVCLSVWYANCVLFALIAFSRWITLTRPQFMVTVFKKRTLWILHLLPWALILAFYFACLVVYPTPLFRFYPCLFTWGFAMTVPLGEYLHWHNFVFNSACAVVESFFNILSFKWVHKTRKSIQTIENTENRRREINLLIQCSVIGSVFTLASVMFTIVFAAGLNTHTAYLVMQCVWTSNHCVNPLVYFSVNKKLRRNLLRLLGLGKLAKNQVNAIHTPCVAGAGGQIAMNEVV